MTANRIRISNDAIEKISNPSNWSGDSSRVNFNASNLSSDLGDWGDEGLERQITKQQSSGAIRRETDRENNIFGTQKPT